MGKTKTYIDENEFVTEYIKHGRNGTHAVQALNSEVSKEVAAVQANRMLKKAKVQDLLANHAENAVTTLNDLMNDKENTPPETRRKTAVDLLNFAGHNPINKSIKVNQTIEDYIE